jgi:PiT family inorganic phosphate transporter
VNESLALLVIVVGTAIAFDFTNGFHDTANAIATSIATRALKPRAAVTLCALLNFAGAFLSYFGYPLSTTHVVSGGILGTGPGKRLAAVDWGIAGRMVLAWVLTLPAAALVAGLVWKLADAVGSGATGSVIWPCSRRPRPWRRRVRGRRRRHGDLRTGRDGARAHRAGAA